MELTIAYYKRWLHDDESIAPPRNVSSMLKDSRESEHPCYESDA